MHMKKCIQATTMLKRFGMAFWILTAAIMFVPDVWAVRIKDIADIKGVRQNQLVGYGLVVGLEGTGDSDSS